MKSFVLTILTISLLFTSCKKNNPAPESILLTNITVANKIESSFEYNDAGQLIKEKYYGICTDNPQDEYVYIYQNNRLQKIQSVIRSLYSSTISMCNPATGFHVQDEFTYNSAGRVSKITKANSVIEYIYNHKGLIEKKIIMGGTNPLIYQYEYDARGNVTKETDAQGIIREYEYDTKKNPLFYNKSRSNILTPYTMSPNNVIKGKGAGYIFERKFEYDLRGLPIKVLEDNGQTYKYTYE